MDVEKLLAELKLEREELDQAIDSLKRMKGRNDPNPNPPLSPASPASSAETVELPFGRKRV
jgi:hypothetical protein